MYGYMQVVAFDRLGARSSSLRLGKIKILLPQAAHALMRVLIPVPLTAYSLLPKHQQLSSLGRAASLLLIALVEEWHCLQGDIVPLSHPDERKHDETRRKLAQTKPPKSPGKKRPRIGFDTNSRPPTT